MDWSSQLMGAVRMRVQTANKKYHNNSQVIHTTPIHHLMSIEVKSYLFVTNKSINMTFLTSRFNKPFLLAKIQVPHP